MREIKLTQGHISIVDEEDYEHLNQWKWFVQKGAKTFYAARSETVNGKKRMVLMHRYILGLGKFNKKDVDHVSGDGLDNRRLNLRICSRSQNQMNASSRNGSTSRYKGVHWHKGSNSWRAAIKANKKYYALGNFKDEESAAIAYNKAAIKYHGKYARLNDV